MEPTRPAVAPSPDGDPAAHARYRLQVRAALWSGALSIALAALKAGSAAATGSLAVLASAVDSLTDVGLTAIALGVIVVARWQARRHHSATTARLESIAALVQVAVTVALGVSILAMAARQVAMHEMTMRPPMAGAAMAVLGTSAAVDFSRAAALRRLGESHGSQVLLASALNFHGDAWQSLVSFASLGTLHLGLAIADPLASVVAGVLMLHGAAALGRASFATLRAEPVAPGSAA